MQTVKDLGHSQRDSSLAGAGVTGKTHMQGRRFGCELELSAYAIYKKERRNLTNAGLDWLQSDQVAIELVKHFLYIGLVEFRGEIDSEVFRRRVCLLSAVVH